MKKSRTEDIIKSPLSPRKKSVYALNVSGDPMSERSSVQKIGALETITDYLLK